VRPVDESAAPWFPGRGLEEVRELYEIGHGLAEGAAKTVHDRDTRREQDEDVTAELAREASTPVIDERDQRRRSRERHR
jgi:hypothetical protein